MEAAPLFLWNIARYPDVAKHKKAIRRESTHPSRRCVAVP